MSGKRKKTSLEEVLAPHIEEAKQKELETNHPEIPDRSPGEPEPEPFICLGQNGKVFVYWVRRNQSILEITPEKHNMANLLYLAPKEYWTDKCGENWRTSDAAAYLLRTSGAPQIQPRHNPGYRNMGREWVAPLQRGGCLLHDRGRKTCRSR